MECTVAGLRKPSGYTLIYLGANVWSFYVALGKWPDLADRWLLAAFFRAHDFRKSPGLAGLSVTRSS